MDLSYWSVPIVLSVLGIIVCFMPGKRARTSAPDFDETPTETDAGLSTFEFVINPDVLKQRDTSLAKTDREQNTQTLQLLFGLLERTIWICDHNFRNDIGDSRHESFWKRYYEAYIRVELPFGLRNINKSPDELREMMLRRAKSVYDVPLVEPPRHDPDAPVEQMLTEMMRFNQQMVAEGTHDDLAMRDDLRDWMEKDIKLAFDDPEKAEECIETHWRDDTITYFREQDRKGIAYSRDAWRVLHPALFPNALEKVTNPKTFDKAENFHSAKRSKKKEKRKRG